MFRFFIMLLLLIATAVNAIMIITGNGSAQAWFIMIPCALIWFILYRAGSPGPSRRFIRKMDARHERFVRDRDYYNSTH